MKGLVICGFDEAGRGPLAGPVVAAACILSPDFPRGLLGDSKALSKAARERAFEALTQRAWWGLGWCHAAEIDELNILQASLEAMVRAWHDLKARFPEAQADEGVVDGLHLPPHLPLPSRALVRADSLVPEVSAASILAKVTRDRWMIEAHRLDPRYGFDQHKGYPTAAHRRALADHGPGPLHRRSFRFAGGTD